MLDRDTKQRINNTRQILVGKVPDPKSQVEQITTALIYKFMDDMDREVEELGGKPQFLTGKLKEFSWGHLMSKELSGRERWDLYTRALEEFSKAEQIPELFRRIFKDAYLPYRDPETLNLFLKEINGFSYEHSENLGNAYEYLLSILGSQGDAGQFRTPRHIIDFIVEVVDPEKTDRILDPACGTAGFLISAYKHIVRKNSENYDPEKYIPLFAETKTSETDDALEYQVNNGFRGEKLTPDDRKKLANNIIGYDISPDMVRLSLVNMYLHGFQTPQIFEYDTLTFDDKWDEYFDVIMANPPFMTPKGGIRPHKRFQIQANRAEVLFVDYIAEHLTINGKAGIIVPEGIIFQSAKAYKNLRKNLVENWGLYAVVSLPSGVFQPYAGVKTSILFIDRQLAKKTNEILFIKVENDGYDLGAQRRKIDKNDLPEAYKILKAWQKGEKIESKLALWVKKEKLAENGEYNLTGDRYREVIDYSNVKWPMVALGDLEKNGDIEFLRGQGLSKKDINPSGKNKCIHYGELYTLYDPIIKEVKSKTNINGKILSVSGDVLIPATTTADSIGIAIARALNENDVILGGDINIIRTRNKKIDSRFLSLLLNYPLKKELANYAKGVNILHLSNKDIKQIKIPLPPLEVQKQIVEEIEGYQKIIDGARQVVDNWKPVIKIDPDWPRVKLGEVCKFVRGPFGGSLKKEIFVKDGFAIYEQYHAIYGDFTKFRYFIDEKKYNEMIRFKVNPNDLIMSCSGTLGKTAIIPNNAPKGIINQALLKLSPNYELNVKYLKLIFEDDNFQNNLLSFTGGAAIKNVASVKVLKQIKIPLPSIEIQKQIVAEIEKEEKIISELKELIKIYEKKIKDKINEVWGER